MSRSRAAGLATLVVALGTVGVLPSAHAAEPESASADRLYLVTLEGPGTAGLEPGVPDVVANARLHAEQDAVLDRVGVTEPVYRWTTALNGVAVRLTRQEASVLRADPRVALVEQNAVRPLAGRTAMGAPMPKAGAGVPGLASRTSGGAGVVVGVVDSGIWPDSPAFSAVPGLGRAPRGFDGACQGGEGGAPTTCNGKVVGARWFVDGFGEDRLRSTSSLSPVDDDGHGSQVASIAAGNAGVSARVREQRLGTYAGVAPQARLAVYKACWSAPDPDDDGCATADLVSAIDAATADGVDVLNVSVGGPARPDTVERALLGATEDGVVVVGAAGNAARAPAAHASPWVTTVGGTTGPVRRGRVELDDGTTFGGAMAADRTVGPARLVVGVDVPAAGATRRDASVCAPGSLDAARVAGRIVLCDRGEIGRVDKSEAVARADGLGMVLANISPGMLVADFHSVPTVHVDRAAGRALRRWVVTHPKAMIRLEPMGMQRAPLRVARWSSGGAAADVVLKPDVVATGSGVLGVVPPGDDGLTWDLASGTSAAAAVTSGAAALVVSAHPDWSAAAVRSALATTAHRLSGTPVLRSGAGRVTPGAGVRPGLVYDVAPDAYRAWLEGDRTDLNTPWVLLRGTADTAERTVTNATGRRLYFSSSARGFAHHQVQVTPAAVRLGPGESATFTVTVERMPTAQPVDDGWVTWRGATGTLTRIPVVIAR